MNKYIKIILGIIFIIALLLLSPIISLILPLKLTNHTYYILLYHVIVDKETEDCFSDEEKALRLFQYVVSHEFARGTPYNANL